jgi:hypothetical protein
MIVEETRLIETCIFNTVQANLLNINISQLIPDLIHITDSSQRTIATKPPRVLWRTRD